MAYPPGRNPKVGDATRTAGKDRPHTIDATPHTEVAWTLIAETLASGTMTLGDGSLREIETPQLVNLVKWLASLNANRKRATVALPDAFAKLVS
jgi:hypothetical protein